MMYRAGLPGWRLAARLGLPIAFRADVYYDREVRSYWASSRDIDGLVVSGASLDELNAELHGAARELLQLKLGGNAPAAVAELRLSVPLMAAP